MGTRCITIIYSDIDLSSNGTPAYPLMKLYRQFDGDPQTHGLELAQFINSKKIVNGMHSSQDRSKIANGMGCLAAQFIAHLKNGPGSYYLLPLIESEYGCQDYTYHVFPSTVEVIGGNRCFSGTWKYFLKFCAENYSS